MTTRKIAAFVVLAAAAGMSLTTAASAHATTIIGGFNGTYYNACSNNDGQVKGMTKQDAGSAGGLVLEVPLTGPTNQCGNLGLRQENPRSGNRSQGGQGAQGASQSAQGARTR
ncbi:hypothetical protein [Streptomyces sp. NPDC046261]|uniref:hypothetical protein n=1 Tax=Streptomyces sp. NPDC046261 TaxID=3157200 RepID=UPI0034086975